MTLQMPPDGDGTSLLGGFSHHSQYMKKKKTNEGAGGCDVHTLYAFVHIEINEFMVQMPYLAIS